MGTFFLAALCYILIFGNINAETLLSYSPKNKLIAILFLLLAYAIKSQTVVIFYGAIVAATVMIFPPVEAFFINIAGSAIMLTLPYLVGRYSDSETIKLKVEKNPKLKAALDLMRDRVFLGTFLLRVSALPGDLIALFYGTLKVKFIPYFFGSLLGLMPAMLTYTFLALGFSKKSPLMIVSTVVYVLMVAAALLTLRKMQKSADRR